MSDLPTLTTARLILRAFRHLDAPTVQRLAGDPDIADTTLNIPHPYEPGVAEAWIATHAEAFARGEMATFAIERRRDDELVGAIGLTINRTHERAEMGYWIGRPYWGNGYCTEAARRVVEFAFLDLGLRRVVAHHLTRNPASGRVMQKIGMKQEGLLRRHLKKYDTLEDVAAYGLLREEYFDISTTPDG